MSIRTIAPLLILLLLGGLAFYFMNVDSAKKANSDQDWVMHIENADDIHRVFIADRKGGKADIVRKGRDWIYNGKYTANPYVMANVLDAITRVRLKNRPTAAAVPNMVKTLSSNSKKVEIYGKNNVLLKSYYVGGVTPDERGTFMIMEGSNNPYVMHIPMNEVSLKHRFFTEELKRRDKTVFRLEPSDIAKVSLEYPKRKNKSFVLEKFNRKWEIKPFYQTTRVIDKPVSKDLVESYLKEFKRIGAESIETKTQDVMKTLSQKEFCIVKLVLIDGSEQQVNFFPILKFEGENNDKPKPVERYRAVNEKGDIFLTQHLVFKDIFWAYDFFF